MAAAVQNPTDYEQPLNERMRTFLRLEFLYQQLGFHLEQPDPWCTRAAVSALLEILAITARGDVRSDALKELERHMSVIHEYQARPGADPERVHSIVANLAKLRTDLNSAGVAQMQRLRDSEFLNAIKHRSAIPGGTCEFDLPDYAHWLSLPFGARIATLNDWVAIVRPLCDAVVELLCIALPAESNLFPEISGSHHRCTIRFLKWTAVESRAVQTEEDVSFLLTTCT